MLSTTYSTATRQDLVDVATTISKAALVFLSTNPNESFFIDISGDAGSGKSLFWDVFVNELLGQSALFIPKKSFSSQSNGRLFETWKGFNKTTDKDVTLFFCNFLSSRGQLERPVLDNLFEGRHKNIADIILLTNGARFMELFTTPPNLQISILMPKGGEPISFSFNLSNIRSQLEKFDTRWARDVEITSNFCLM